MPVTLGGMNSLRVFLYSPNSFGVVSKIEAEISRQGKNYPKEFEIMFDIFQKFIELYNCFFADSNGEDIYRIKKAKKLLAQFFKMKYNEKEKYHVPIGIKYSTRDIANLPEKEVKSIYRLMEKCYYAIYYIEETEKKNRTVENVKDLIKKKMKKLVFLEKRNIFKNLFTQMKQDIYLEKQCSLLEKQH